MQKLVFYIYKGHRKTANRRARQICFDGFLYRTIPSVEKKIMNAIAFPEMPLQARILRQIGKKIPRATTTSLGKMFRRFLIENASKC